MTESKPDPAYFGWEQVSAEGRSEPFRLHSESGTWVRKMVSKDQPDTPYWEVYAGRLDGARFPSAGLAVYAVEHAWEKYMSSKGGA